MSKSLLLGNQKIMAKERERERFERARVLVMHHSWGFAREMVTKIAWIVCGGEEREESKWCRKLDCVCGERERERLGRIRRDCEEEEEDGEEKGST